MVFALGPLISKPYIAKLMLVSSQFLVSKVSYGTEHAHMQLYFITLQSLWKLL